MFVLSYKEEKEKKKKTSGSNEKEKWIEMEKYWFLC